MNTRPRHSVEDGQQLPRTSGESHLLGLAGVQQAPIELSQYRIKSGGYQRSHVESRTHLGSTSPDGTFAAIRTTISIEGRHTDQSRDLLAVQLAQLRQICEQCQRHLRPHAVTFSETVDVPRWQGTDENGNSAIIMPKLKLDVGGVEKIEMRG